MNDAGGDGAVVNDAMATDDGAPSGTLSPDPLDPVGLPCNGTLGFPAHPALELADSAFMEVIDVDGDAIPDIVTKTTNVRVFRGVGNGLFHAPIATPITDVNGEFRVANLVGDSNPDLLLGIRDGLEPPTYKLRVLPGDGTGQFGAAQLIDLGGSFDEVAVADLNNDGKNDIIVRKESGSEIRVLLAGATSFGPVQTYDAGSQFAVAMAVADVTGDGRPDILATNRGEQKLVVLVNNGNGTFAAGVSYPAGTAPDPVIVVDVNEDTLPDVVVGNDAQLAAESKFSVLLNSGGGVFGAPTTIGLGQAANTPVKIIAADVNADGHVDLGFAMLVSNVAVVLGSGTGQFGAAKFFATTSPAPRDLAFADLDMNGRPDLVVVDRETISPHLNTGTAALFEARTPLAFDTSITNGATALATHLDADQRLDLISIGVGGGSGVVATKLALGGGTFDGAVTYSPATGGTLGLLLDVDNDARQDVLLVGYTTGGTAADKSLQTLRNAGNGMLTAAAHSPITYRDPSWRIGDIDSDGFRDVVLADRAAQPTDPTEIRFYPGDGTGEFGSPVVLWSGGFYLGHVVIDVDGDDVRDLVVTTVDTSYRQHVVRGTGNGTFASVMSTDIDNFTPFATRDFDEDGKQDIIGLSSTEIVVQLGSGTSSPGTMMRTQGSFDPAKVAFADFDGDGHLDLATVIRDRVKLYRGRGDGSFLAPWVYEGGGDAIAVGDLDDDGRLDILLHHVSDSYSILKGRCL